MNKKTQESLVSALSYASLKELPEEDTKENVWIRAIAKVKKFDNCDYFVCVKKGRDGENKVARDFGSQYAISKVEAFYPYEFLKAAYMPKIEKQSKKAYVEYLMNDDPSMDVSDMSLKELQSEVIRRAIVLQMLNEEQNKY